jgi:MraZ protein
MFLGQYSHTIDDKGRLTIPAKFRDELESGVVITRGLDGCLWAYSRTEWDELSEKLRKLPSTNQAVRNYVRFVSSNAFDSIPDRQGRVLLPPELRDFAGIQNETVIIGVMNKLEIWNPEKWSQVVKEVESDPDGIVAQLQEWGI